ncbi:hypothetical protein KDN24_06470 [Bacillus sp. Bva_UNVM-123]|uniref:hypothetical protein n=1 Tax=Bacillus sp. Bva_UNVM-123 TaxID=2829798 RepID=UPI00391F2852
MVRNHVILTDKGYIKNPSILSYEGKVEINKVNYTDNLLEAAVFSESDYQDDKLAWEDFCEKELFFSFQYLEIDYQIKGEIV